MRYIFDQTKTIDSSAIYDEKLYRQLKLLKNVGPSALPADQLDRVCKILNIFFQKFKLTLIKKLSQIIEQASQIIFKCKFNSR